MIVFYLFIFQSILVVFDGGQLNDRKLETILDRTKQRIDNSLSVNPEVNLSPLLLRETLISVLDAMKIPYVSALGEGDDECVSLANHLDCYLIAQDSDYYCHNLHRGYVPFDYINIDPISEGSPPYLEARLYHINSLLEQFPNLQRQTLTLACCLCGNDYISSNLTKPILDHIVDTVDKSKRKVNHRNKRTYEIWCAMEWMRQFNNINLAFDQLRQLSNAETGQIQIEDELRLAVQPYLTPSDTLVYRFVSSENRNLLTNDYFVQRARTYLKRLHQVTADACIL